MKFSDHAGSITIDSGHFKAFAYAWYMPNDLVSIVAMPVNKTKKSPVPSQIITIEDLLKATNEDFESWCYLDEDRQTPCNMYMAISPLKDGTVLAPGKRGDESNFKGVYGAFVDLDVESPSKLGCFKSKEEINEFLNSLEYPPTIVVDNGASGGVHAYWRLHRGETGTKELLERWWSYLSTQTERKIDKLIDITRISRMPSCIYWAKRDGDKTDTVKVLSNSGPTYSLEQMNSITEAAFVKYKQRRKDVINKESQRKWSSLPDLASKLYKEYTGDGYNWGAMRIIANIEDIYNEKVDWEDVLIPNGWTFLRDLNDGAREWARPGRDERSAVTDFDYGDGNGASPVMSLLSSAEETGLFDLKDAGIPLTKYRVSLRLDFDDDDEKFIEYIRQEILGL